MKRPLVLACLLLSLLLWPSAEARADKETSLADQVAALAKPYLDAEVLVGAAIGIVKGDQRYVFGVGRRSLGDERPPDGDTIYEIGSITKVFTGTLLADLVERGKLKLEQRAQDLLPEDVQMPRKGDEQITLMQLANHTSGLPRMPSNFNPADVLDPYADYDAKRLYDGIQMIELQSVPGTKYAYSNLGMGLLGHLLARQTPSSYEDLLHTCITGPLGMKSTGITLDETLLGRLAPGTNVDLTPQPNWRLDAFAGAGAVRSTANDMLVFLAAHLKPDSSPLEKSILGATQVTFTPPDGKGFKIGLGWHFARSGEGLWHNGQTGGYHSYAAFLPGKGFGVVVLSNTATPLVDALGESLIRMVAGVPSGPPPKIRRPVEVAPEVLEAYVGYYQLAPLTLMVIRREGAKLFARLGSQQEFRIYPESETEFFYRVVDAQISFEKDEEGKVLRLVLHQNNRDLPASRL